MAHKTREARNHYARSYYATHPEYRERALARASGRDRPQQVAGDSARRREKRLWLVEVLGGRCVECGEEDERALDVHHPNGKDQPIAYQRSWEYIKEQAMVTILLCSTCHRRNHKPG